MDLSNDGREFSSAADLKKFRCLQLRYTAMNVALGRVEIYDLIPILSLARQEGLSAFEAGLIVTNAIKTPPSAMPEVRAA